MRRGNLGASGFKTRRRKEDPMRSYDALPSPVRMWLSQAVMPWSPASCRKILRAAKARGDSLEQVIERLERAEQKMLAREGEDCAIL